MVAASNDPRPGLKVWEWERNLLVAFAATLAGFAGAVLAVAFTLKSSGRVIAFVVVGALVAATLIFFFIAANKPDEKKRKRGPEMVDPKDSFASPVNPVGRKSSKSPRDVK